MATSDEEPVFMVNDPVHGSIELRGKAVSYIIDTEAFQRLRKIKQLGGNSYVYPGATHTRFEHSIGVCFIASELMSYLKTHDETAKKVLDEYLNPDRTCNKPKIDYEKCVKVAALCHDLGHGPFSHLYDTAVKEKLPATVLEAHDNCHHEYRSVEILEKLVLKDNEDKHGVNSEEVKVIGKMITFSNDCKATTKGNIREDYLRSKKQANGDTANINKAEMSYYERIKSLGIAAETFFLYEIVANGFTEIDVDKMDYFIRDGHGLGLPCCVFEWRRYIQTLGVCEKNIVIEEGGPNEKITFKCNRLCSRDKEALELYQLFHTRNQLYRQALKHKTTVAVERMIIDAMKEAHEGLFIAIRKDEGEDVKKLKFLEAWRDTSCFLHLNDSFEDIIIDGHIEAFPARLTVRDGPRYYLVADDTCSVEPAKNKIKKASTIFENIRKRKIMKYIGDCKSSTDQKNIRDQLCDALVSELKLRKTKKKDVAACAFIVIEKVKFHYGMNETDPITEHYFFRKKAKTDPFHLPKDEVSKMLPVDFSEEKLMVYFNAEELYRFDEVKTKLRNACELDDLMKQLQNKLEEIKRSST